MQLTFNELLQQAQGLRPEEQAALSEYLMEQLLPRDEAWETAWADECDRRIAACERGEMETIDSDEVMQALRRKYGLS